MVAVRERLVLARVMACRGAQSAASYDLERTKVGSTVAEREGSCQGCTVAYESREMLGSRRHRELLNLHV
jgi:hypothetical protein